MTSAMLTELLYCFIILGVLLLLGTFLRVKIPLLQKLFLPASVIGGFVGLMIGPNIWSNGGLALLPESWNSVCSALPGLLNVLIVSAIPLTMLGEHKESTQHSASNAAKVWLIILATFFLQILIGLGTLALFKSRYDLYPTFGYELITGYNGGHGTAGVLGKLLEELNLPYWSTAQGVASTTATFGLVGGMVIGIAYVNIMVRRGKGAILDKPANIPQDMLKGVYLHEEDQPTSCRETTYSSTIESMTFHLSLLLLCGGISYAILNWFKAHHVPVIKDFSVLTFCIFVMFGISWLLKKLHLSYLIDGRTISKISGTCADFAIAAAMASMPVQAVFKYAVPILFMCVLGYVLTFGMLVSFTKWSFKDYHLERMISMWGNCTGTYITGITLLKIVDPGYTLPVLCDYSIGFAFTSPASFIVLSLTVPMLLRYSTGVNAAIQAGLLVLTFAALWFVNHISAKRETA